MENRSARREHRPMQSFLRVVRAFAEGSLAALGFAVAILLLGAPVALSVRGVHDAFMWLASTGGEPSAFIHALVAVVSVAGGVVLVALGVTLLARTFNWRRGSRDRASGRSAADRGHGREAVARAA